jgi:hypothetical protein
MMQERAIVLRHIGWSRLLGSASGLLIGLALVLLAAAPLASAQAIVEFTVPGAGSQPTGITTGPDGNLWFTEFGSSEIGRITPAGLVEEFVLPAGRGPDSIVSGPDGLLWFTERSGDRIGRINPNAGNHAAIQASIVEFTVPGAGSQPTGITTGSDGNLWFTEFGSSEIGRITTDRDGYIQPYPNAHHYADVHPRGHQLRPHRRYPGLRDLAAELRARELRERGGPQPRLSGGHPGLWDLAPALRGGRARRPSNGWRAVDRDGRRTRGHAGPRPTTRRSAHGAEQDRPASGRPWWSRAGDPLAGRAPRSRRARRPASAPAVRARVARPAAPLLHHGGTERLRQEN